LYNNFAMQDKLLSAYKEKCRGKKTLIFNNGIATSQYVYATFREAGFEVRHLDHSHNAKERREILDWFRDKPDAVLTSVSILTTGFDEPGVECIILNRATKSLTLYLQMIGRGSRILPDKKEFSIIDLGNNLHRFGLWDEFIDWPAIFEHPEMYLEGIPSDEFIERNYRYEMPPELRLRFARSADLDMDISAVHREVMAERQRPKLVIERSMEQHVRICKENSNTLDEALDLADLLKEEVDYRVRMYARCLAKTSESYVKWLQDEYKRTLKVTLIRDFHQTMREE
jgi:type I site-specific restriction endonuclease